MLPKYRIVWRVIKKKRRKSPGTKYQKYKHAVLAMAKSQVIHFNQYYNFAINRIAVKNQKTRWGSCSKKGNLNFNYKIYLLPRHLADYVIVHELCHLGEFNHSPAFWKLVAKTI